MVIVIDHGASLDKKWKADFCVFAAVALMIWSSAQGLVYAVLYPSPVPNRLPGGG